MRTGGGTGQFLSRPMRVMLFIGELNMGGAERQFIELAKGLKKKGIDVEVMLNRSGGHFLKELNQTNIRYSVLHLSSIWGLPVYLLRAISELTRSNPDVVYGFMGAGIKATLFNVFVPRFKVIWGVRSSNIDAMQQGVSLKLAGWLDCKLSRFADAIVYNSYAGKMDRNALGWADINSYVIPNGIDFERFKPCPIAKQETRERLGLRPEHIAFGMLARLDVMKDHSNLLSAFALLRDPNKRLVLTCEEHKPLAVFLQTMVFDLGITDKVIWVGRDIKPEQFLNALDIYVQSSAYGEGFPNAIGEAMSIGLPIVTTDVGDCRMIVGDCGWVVAPCDPKALEEALQSAITALPLWNWDEPRQRVIVNYGLNRMVESTLTAILEVMN